MMRVTHANLGRGVGTPEFEDNLDKVLKFGGPFSVFCFQEIDEADTPEEMELLIERTQDTHELVGRGWAVPILVPYLYDVVDRRVTHACDGLAKVTPQRVVVEATVRITSELEVGLLNLHLPLLRPSTLLRRRQCRRCLRRRAGHHTNGVWVADTNTHRMWPRMVKGERSATEAGIDKAKVWAGPNREVHIKDRRSADLTIDGHNAHRFDVSWRKAA